MTDFDRNFSILNAKGIKVAVTNVSQRIELDRSGGDDIMIINNTAVSIFAITGNKDVVALDSTETNPSMEVLPGEKGVYNKGSSGGNTTHIAFIADLAGPANITFYQGTGV